PEAHGRRCRTRALRASRAAPPRDGSQAAGRRIGSERGGLLPPDGRPAGGHDRLDAGRSYAAAAALHAARQPPKRRAAPTAMSTPGHLARIGAAAAVIGAATLFISTLLHPMSADPNDAPAAFAEYAADRLWVASHLGQFVGVAILGVALVALAAAMEPGRAAAWARIGIVGTAASVAVAAGLQAVDGVALRMMVTRWMRADGDARARAFEGAFAVRQVEVGMASLLSVLFGLTISTFGVAMLSSRRFPKWLGGVRPVRRRPPPPPRAPPGPTRVSPPPPHPP